MPGFERMKTDGELGAWLAEHKSVKFVTMEVPS